MCNLKPYGKKLKPIANKAITDAHIKTSLLIHFGSRACASHFNSYGFLNESSLSKN